MNFFEHQDQSRRQTRWLVFLFILAVVAIVAAVNLVLLIGFGVSQAVDDPASFTMPSPADNVSLLLGGAAMTTAVIVIASLTRTLGLRGGGGKVAVQLGAIRVDTDTRDPLKRRLVNVVEEIALASGIPVPEIYVMEQEAGINAFAAGYGPADAAIAVTRGTLEKLSRVELQGVIAHEFSHIFNGDMRLNIRLMGALFGILMLAIIGRRVLIHSHIMGRSRDKGGVAILALAAALVVVGYMGLFFGRWIKAAVSRQREYLADASAVQFTRDPDGISGALKKIAVYSDASFLETDSEEVGHMLFGAGRKTHMFATHPPLAERISRIDPSFQAEDLDLLAARLQRESISQARQAEREQQERAENPAPFDAGRIIDAIGNPGSNQLLIAAVIAAGIPEGVSKAAHSTERAPEVLVYSLMHVDDESREQQLLAVADRMGAEFEARVHRMVRADGPPAPEQRLPLLEMALPGLRRHPTDTVQNLLAAVDDIIRVDGQIEVFEYLMVRMIRQYLWDSANPHLARPSGRKTLARLSSDVETVIAIVAAHGNPSDQQAANRAYQAGITEALGQSGSEAPDVSDWTSAMDKSLDKLDKLAAAEKKKLVQALIATVTMDQKIVPEELELMRVVCSALHVPIPALA